MVVIVFKTRVTHNGWMKDLAPDAEAKELSSAHKFNMLEVLGTLKQKLQQSNFQVRIWAQSRPKVDPQSAQVLPKSAQSRPKVGPKSTNSWPNVAQSRPKVASNLAESWPKVGPKSAQSRP